MYYRLQHFLHVVDDGTFTQAARSAALTQPALSASIQRLEEELDAVLFLRSRRGAELTDAGRALLPHARAAIAAVEEGRRAVRNVQGLETGEVVIAGGATATTYLLPAHLAAFQQQHPGVTARLIERSTEGVITAILSGAVDLGIATRLHGDDADWPVVEEPWLEDPLILVEAPDETRKNPPYCTFVETSPLRTLLDRHFPEAVVRMELGSIPAIKGHVAAGAGIALVPRSAVQHTIDDSRLRERPDPRTPLQRRLLLVHRGVDRLSAAAGAFRQQLLAG